MSLSMTAQVVDRDLDVALELPSGQTLALLGRNGAGKSTALAVLAGLVRPDTGHAELAGRTLFSSADEVFVPAHERHIALLAQEPLLFPHLGVADNVAFGPRSQGRSKTQARREAQRWLEEVDAIEFSDRTPAQLSGGQAQRVALARALATQPELLLLDEPLAALDVEVATSVRQTLRRVLTGRTSIIVTHDILDAVLLADRIAVVAAGRIVEQGTTAAVMQRPKSAFTAGICGWNMVEGTGLSPQSLVTPAGTVVQGQADPGLVTGQSAFAVFRPSAVSVHRTLPTGSPRNVLSGMITALEPQAHLIRVRVDTVSADITPASVAALDLSVGGRVHLAVKAAEVSLYAA